MQLVGFYALLCPTWEEFYLKLIWHIIYLSTTCSSSSESNKFMQHAGSFKLVLLLQHNLLAGISLSSRPQMTVKTENWTELLIFLVAFYPNCWFLSLCFPIVNFKNIRQHACTKHKMIFECVWLRRWIVSVLCVNGLLKAPLDRWFTKVRGETDMWTTPSIMYSAALLLHDFSKCVQFCSMLTAHRGKWGVLLWHYETEL